MRTIIAVTGASGMPYAVDFVRRCPGTKYAIFTRWGRHVLRQETGLEPEDLSPHLERLFSDGDLTAPIASGGARVDSMVVIPCSASTLARIAAGVGDSLLTRAAHVTLKERRRLVLCLREAPLATIDLENALRVARAGGIVMPLAPFFYLQPQSLEELIAQLVDRVIALAGGPPPRAWRDGELGDEG